jgi:dUTP pyrophosphatase
MIQSAKSSVQPLVKIKKLNSDAAVPFYATAGAAGCDIRVVDTLDIPAHSTRLFRTGLAVEIPEGWELQIRSRSGLSLKGITVANSPGTIDSDYRGEVGILLRNDKPEDVVISAGERVAQMVLAPVFQAKFEVVEELSATERGAGGFGSTGVK